MSTYEEKLERARRWRREHPERQAAHGRRHTLKTKYGMTPEDYDAQLAEQGGKCAICHTTETHPWPYFVVDHDHETGELRGLLCHRCNVGIGQFNDDPLLVAGALGYLAYRGWKVPASHGKQLGLEAC